MGKYFYKMAGGASRLLDRFIRSSSKRTFGKRLPSAAEAAAHRASATELFDKQFKARGARKAERMAGNIGLKKRNIFEKGLDSIGAAATKGVDAATAKTVGAVKGVAGKAWNFTKGTFSSPTARGGALLGGLVGGVPGAALGATMGRIVGKTNRSMAQGFRWLKNTPAGNTALKWGAGGGAGLYAFNRLTDKTAEETNMFKGKYFGKMAALDEEAQKVMSKIFGNRSGPTASGIGGNPQAIWQSNKVQAAEALYKERQRLWNEGKPISRDLDRAQRTINRLADREILMQRGQYGEMLKMRGAARREAARGTSKLPGRLKWVAGGAAGLYALNKLTAKPKKNEDYYA